jgi:IclR family transcriptional regulator, acetate operon repressor
VERTRDTLESLSQGGVQSVERALDLLECIARSAGWMGISELSAATGQPVGTVHRLLATLAAREYVVRDSRTRRYALGPAFRMLVGVDPQMPNWAEIATPFLREVVEVSGETANLAVKEHNHAVYVAQAQAARMVRMFTELGNRVALHSSGCGKVLLAYQPESVVSAIIAEAGLPAYTPETITDPERLRKELATIRQNGYASDSEEVEEGVGCLAVPVFDAKDKVVAAMSISGPTSRLTNERIATLVPELKRISRHLSDVLLEPQKYNESA